MQIENYAPGVSDPRHETDLQLVGSLCQFVKQRLKFSERTAEMKSENNSINCVKSLVRSLQKNQCFKSSSPG